MYRSSLHLRLTHPDPSSLQFRHVPKLFAHFGQRRRFRCFRRSRFDVLPRQRSVRIVGRRGRGSTPSPTLFLGLFWRDPSRPQILPMFSFGHVGTVILVAPQHQTLSQKPQHTLRPQHACHHLFHVVVQQNVSDGTGVRVSIQHGKHLRHLAVNNKKQKRKAKSQKTKVNNIPSPKFKTILRRALTVVACCRTVTDMVGSAGIPLYSSWTLPVLFHVFECSTWWTASQVPFMGGNKCSKQQQRQQQAPPPPTKQKGKAKREDRTKGREEKEERLAYSRVKYVFFASSFHVPNPEYLVTNNLYPTLVIPSKETSSFATMSKCNRNANALPATVFNVSGGGGGGGGGGGCRDKR